MLQSAVPLRTEYVPIEWKEGVRAAAGILFFVSLHRAFGDAMSFGVSLGVRLPRIPRTEWRPAPVQERSLWLRIAGTGHKNKIGNFGA